MIATGSDHLSAAVPNSSCGLADAYRELHPDGRDYTEWAYSRGDVNRLEDKGFRISYFLVSRELLPEVSVSCMHAGVRGSDSCPCELVINM